MPNDILKRLDIIKNAVAMEEDDLIAMQVQKLEKLSLDEQVQHILALIRAQQFQDVIQLIEQYKHDSSGLTVYEDPQIQGLKLELKLLENRLNELTDTQADLEREINEFNSEYFRRLGGLIEEILKRRADLCSDETEKQQAKQDYEEFERGYQQQLEDAPQTLTPEQLQELKTAYRKASRLCHPDKLADEFKAQGEAFFKELHDAYRRQDLKRVTEILTALETGGSLNAASDSLNNKEALQTKIAALREKIGIFEFNIENLQADDAYQLILSIDDMDGYFSKLELELKAEIKALHSSIIQKQLSAAEEGFPSAQYNLGIAYKDGLGVEKNDEQSVQWWRKAAEQGHASAQYALGWSYENGKGIEKDISQALNWYRLAAENGNASGARAIDRLK